MAAMTRMGLAAVVLELVVGATVQARRLSMKQPADSEDCDGFAAWADLAWGLAFELVLPSRI